jgi:DNA-binding MarR family transcriptional regulator
MRLSENEVRAQILITRAREPVHPSGLQKELGLLKSSISRIITSLQDIGLVERSGG